MPFKQRFLRSLRFATVGTVLIVALVALMFKSMGFTPEKVRQDRQAATQVALKVNNNVVPYNFAKFEQAMEKEKRPVILFIYTSWCKFCRKEFPLVNETAKLHKDEFAIYAISIDTEPQKLSEFLARQDEVNFTPYSIPDENGQREIESELQAKGLTFDGSFPYLAVFIGGKPAGETKGALEKDVFEAMLADIRAEALRHGVTASPPGQQQTSIQEP